LIYLSKEEFKYIKVLKERFLKRAHGFFKKAPRARFVGKREALESLRSKDFLPGNGNIFPCYESTNILQTRYSLFWSWRRVKRYYDELFEEENIQKNRERVKELIHS